MTGRVQLEIPENNLQIIEGNLFEFNQKLEYVDFDYNKLGRVGDGLLIGLVKLNVAHFRSNSCIREQANTIEEIRDLIQILQLQCSLTSKLQLKARIGRNSNENDSVVKIESFGEESNAKILSLKVKIEELKFKYEQQAISSEAFQDENEAYEEIIATLSDEIKQIKIKIDLQTSLCTSSTKENLSLKAEMHKLNTKKTSDVTIVLPDNINLGNITSEDFARFKTSKVYQHLWKHLYKHEVVIDPQQP